MPRWFNVVDIFPTAQSTATKIAGSIILGVKGRIVILNSKRCVVCKCDETTFHQTKPDVALIYTRN